MNGRSRLRAITSNRYDGDMSIDDEALRPTAMAETSMTTGDPATPPRDGAGSAATERYLVGEQIGRGGMGEVLTARDAQIGRSVAIKRMRDASPDARSIARFLREAKIQGRLEHPAIVPVHELSRDAEGRPFFAMKQLAGDTLADVIAGTARGDAPTLGKFPRRRLLQVFTEVCLAIEFAHAKQIVHRDLKPANIMLGDFGEVYVLDWGIARSIGAASDDGVVDGDLGDSTTSTQVGAMLGTPGYMSPEQVRGDADIDGRADVFALGCILFEILACEPLFSRGKAGLAEVLEGMVDARPTGRAPEREIPPELDDVCLRATAGERDERIATARELGVLVQRYLDGDRDLALRQALARRELAAAEELLSGGLLSTMSHSRQQQKRMPRDEVSMYASAMRAAARALALDPQSRDAAGLVSRLMLEPPTEAPDEVEDRLVELETEATRNHARLGVKALLGYLIFFPVIWLAGLHEPWLVIGGSLLTLGIIVTVKLVADNPTTIRVLASLLGQVVLIGVYSRGLSPFLVAPGVALLTVMVYASHPRLIRAWVLWLLCLGGVLVPLVLEATGLVSTTTSVDGASLIVRLSPDPIDGTVVLVGLAGYVAVILTIATIVTRLQALDQQHGRKLLEMQAWQLRQLAPKHDVRV